MLGAQDATFLTTQRDAPRERAPARCGGTHMMEIRPIRRRIFVPEWVVAAVFVVVILGTTLTGTFWFFLLGFALVVVEGFCISRVRCPACGGRVKFHQTFIGQSKLFRCQFVCNRCQVLWDTGKIGDADSSAG